MVYIKDGIDALPSTTTDDLQQQQQQQQQQQSDLVERLQASLATVEQEKEELVTGFNSTKQEFMMSDFEKSGRIESLEKEIVKLKQQLDGWADKERDIVDSQTLKIKELEECKYLLLWSIFFNLRML